MLYDHEGFVCPQHDQRSRIDVTLPALGPELGSSMLIHVVSEFAARQLLAVKPDEHHLPRQAMSEILAVIECVQPANINRALRSHESGAPVGARPPLDHLF